VSTSAAAGSLSRLQAWWRDELPPGVVRVKGCLRLRGCPGPVLLHMVGRRVSFEDPSAGAAAVAAAAGTGCLIVRGRWMRGRACMRDCVTPPPAQVLIGRGLHAATLRASLERALSSAPDDEGVGGGAAVFRALCDGDVRLTCETPCGGGGLALVRLSGMVTPFVTAAPPRAAALHHEVAGGMAARGGALALVVHDAAAGGGGGGGGGVCIAVACRDGPGARAAHAALEAALVPALTALFMETACC
jgi:hypothetical protein